MTVLGLGDLPLALRYYLVAIGLGGPIAALCAAFRPSDPALTALTGGDLLRAALLTGLALAAERYQFNLTHRMQVNAATACYVAMILALPAGLPGLLALVVIVGGHLMRHREPIETLFNSGQGALATTIAALSFAALGQHGELAALVVAATIQHVGNTGLVSIAAGLHLGTNPLRVWSVTFRDDLSANAVLTLLGVVAATVADVRPLLLPALALPVVLVHRSQRQAVRLRHDTREALAALVEVVELRDPYTAGHSRRVAALARALAVRLGLTHEEADLIESAGRVHDLGKVAIDPAVLMKPGKLTDPEFAEMKRHPALGADVIGRFAAYPDGYRLVRHHHEAWDGTGYPDRLTGEAIPLGSRILAVADTYDALTSDRPYRLGMGIDRALQILNDGAGKQWDARIVAALVAHLAEAEASPRRADDAETAPALA